MADTQNTVDLLRFEVSGRQLALFAREVLEIVRMVELSPLPKPLGGIEGLVNRRGVLVPAFDLRARFQLPAQAPDPAEQLIFAEAGGRIVALRVDRALDILEVLESAVQNAQTVVPGAECLAGIVVLPEGLLLIQDIRAFLSPAEDHALAEALETLLP